MTPALEYFCRINNISHEMLDPIRTFVPNYHRRELATMIADLRMTTGAEIGVFRGEFSEVLCRRNPNLALHCVDPWLKSDGKGDYFHTPPDSSWSNDTYEGYYQEVKQRLSPYPNVKFHRQTSMDAVKQFDDESLDFVYIDGNHKFDYVTDDVREWSKKVRRGGFIAGHDYITFCAKRNPIAAASSQVKRAVNAYTNAHKIAPWFVIDQRRKASHNRPSEYASFLWFKE